MMIHKKLRSQRGETLVELLAAILIATLSVGLLMAGVTLTTRMNRKARSADENFYQSLTAAEVQETPLTDLPDSPTVKILEESTTVEIPVSVYGGSELFSYAVAASGEGGSP